MTTDKPCPTCKGNKWVPTINVDVTCPTCNGTGIVAGEKLEVTCQNNEHGHDASECIPVTPNTGQTFEEVVTEVIFDPRDEGWTKRQIEVITLAHNTDKQTAVRVALEGLNRKSHSDYGDGGVINQSDVDEALAALDQTTEGTEA